MTPTPDLTSLLDLIQQNLWLRDPGSFVVTLATVAANRLSGDPLWLLVIGPPSSGKTEALAALSDLPEVYPTSTLTEAGLLSGSPTGKETPRPAVFCGRSASAASSWPLTSGHCSTSTARPETGLSPVSGRSSTGRLIRRLGTAGGKSYVWEGHAGFLGACTEAVDTPSVDLGLLGERFSYYRMPSVTPADEYMACVVADENAGRQPEIRAERARAVAAFFAELVIPEELPPMTEDEQARLVTLAGLAARCRSSVVRDGYSREIELVPGHERSPRLFAQLRQLHAGLAVIGAPLAETWRLLAKVALDGIHPGRRAVLDFLVDHPGGHSTSAIAGRCRLTETPTRRHLEDLNAHRVLDRSGHRPALWRTSEWLGENWWAAS